MQAVVRTFRINEKDNCNNAKLYNYTWKSYFTRSTEDWIMYEKVTCPIIKVASYKYANTCCRSVNFYPVWVGNEIFTHGLWKP